MESAWQTREAWAGFEGRPRRWGALAAVLLLAAVTNAGAAAPASLVRDIHAGPDSTRSSSPQGLTALGDQLLFFARDDGQTLRLFRSDGATVERISPTAFVSADTVTGVGQRIFFFESRNADSTLWTSDGVTTNALGVFANPCNPRSHRVGTAGDLFFFAADDGVHGEELWRSDGTVAGTRLIDLVAGEGSSSPTSFVTRGNEVFFVAGTAEEPALWRSDGTPEGTKRVRSFPPPATYPQNLAVVGARVFFVVSEPETGYEIWVSDGSEEGTKLFADLRSGPDSLGAQHLTGVGDELFFSAYDPEHGNELWHSDGTPQGTGLVRDIIPGPDGPFGAVEICVCGCTGSAFAVSGSAVFFAVGNQLWTSDGTFDGTKLLKDFAASPWSIFAASDRVYVASRPGDEPPFLWTSDGTVEGTVELGRFTVKELTQVGSGAFFSGNDGRTGFELWRTDGTVDGTALVEDLFSGPGSSNPLHLTAVADRVFFVADDGEHGFELWSSDGSEAGTHLAKDVWPGLDSSVSCSRGSCAREVVAGRGVVFFPALDAPESFGLWRSDGTEEGTTKVVDLTTLAPGDSFGLAQAVGDDLYFTTWTAAGAVDIRLWHWGEAGVGLVKEWIAPDPLRRLFLFEGALHFEGPDGIWRTDGTAEGTVPAFGAGLEVGDFLAAGPRFIFGSAADVWLSDGTADGTHVLRASTGVAREFTQAGGRLYFAAGVAGRELWGSDFTTSGTRTVKEINPSLGSDPHDIAAADGAAVFFTARTQMQGRELWYSDGSVGGTTLVRDIRAGAASALYDVSDPTSGDPTPAPRLVTAGGTVVLGADDGDSGAELWWGQADWASRLQDIAPGPASSHPYGFTIAGGKIFFSADDGEHGRELWALPLSSLETPCASDCGDDGRVTIEELVAAVRIAATLADAGQCLAADVDGDGRVVTGEIKSAVRRALAGC